jgi:LEA14-like dessication related protein
MAESDGFGVEGRAGSNRERQMMQTGRSMKRAGALVLAALLAPACATVKTPILAVDGLKVGDMGISGVALDVGFRVRNPNPEPLTIERFEYELFVNGNRLGRGFEPKGLELAGYGETKVQTRFDVNLLSLPGAVKDVLRQDRVRARAKGRFYATGSFGRKELGFDSDAEVELRR